MRLHLIIGAFFFVTSACSPLTPGTSGNLPVNDKYEHAKSLLRRSERTNEATAYLESVVRKNPHYLDAQTLLGRGYYRQGRYQAALQSLHSAILVNKEDEIAWLLYGLTQLRLGDDQKGLESMKGGLVGLYKKATKNDYRGYESWDKNKLVQSSIRRLIYQIQKGGLDNKQRLIRSGELILIRIDDEVSDQSGDKSIEEMLGDDSG